MRFLCIKTPKNFPTYLFAPCITSFLKKTNKILIYNVLLQFYTSKNLESNEIPSIFLSKQGTYNHKTLNCHRFVQNPVERNSNVM